MTTVRNWVTQQQEKVVYITPDGEKINLHDPGYKAVLSMAGWGIPPVQKATTRAPFQHGRTPLTLRLPPRVVQVVIRHQRGCRADYWTARTALVNSLRYNRSSMDGPTPGKLRWYRSDGTIRQLDVILMGGPDFNPRGSWDEFAIQDQLIFEADNPVVYDPTIVNNTLTNFLCASVTDLTFSLEFIDPYSLSFGDSYCYGINSLQVNYAGNFEEYPIIRVGGPARDFRMVHDQTGLILAFDGYTIPAGKEAVFNLTYNRKTVKQDDTSLLGYISEDSSIGLFSLQPDPIAPSGVNTFTTTIVDGTGDTYVLFSYYNRYISG